MNSNCLNTKNPEVAKLLQDYTNILGSYDAAYALLSKNNGYGLDKNSDGTKSILYEKILNETKNAKEALLKTFSLKEKYGDIAESAIEYYINKTELRKTGKYSEYLDYLKSGEKKSFAEWKNNIGTNNQNNNKIKSPKIENTKELTKVYSDLINSIKRRIKSFEHSSLSNSRALDTLNSLLGRLDLLEEYEAIPEFITYMVNDLTNALRDIRLLRSKYETWAEFKEGDCPITPQQLDLISKGTIGFYENLADNLLNMLDDPEIKSFYSDLSLYQTLQNQLQQALLYYTNVSRIYKDVAGKVAKARLVAEARRLGSFTADELENKLNEMDDDLSMWDRFFGQTQYSNSEVVRLVLNKLTEAKYRVHDEKLSVGKRLVNLLSKCNRSDVELFFERDLEGKLTGNFVSALNFGVHQKEYEQHMIDFVTKKLGVTIPNNIYFNDIPSILNLEQQKKWNKEKLEWDSNNSEMKFKKDYYELLNILSEDAKAVKSQLDLETNTLLDPTRDSNGRVHKEKLTDEEYKKLLIIENKRKNLANPYNLDGTLKTGRDKEIALEFKEYYEKLRDNVKYKADLNAWKKARKEANETLSAEEFRKWDERNSKEEIDESFYEDVKKLAKKSKTFKQIELEEQRQNLLKLYKLDSKVDAEHIPSSVRAQIRDLDKKIAAESKKIVEESNVDEIAEWEVNPRFYKELTYMKNHVSQDAWFAWLKSNTVGYYNGKYIPASFWRKMVPRKDLKHKYVKLVPSSAWIELDPNSNFYNKNFDSSYGVARIPKRSKYDNSKNFNKIKGNAKILYDALREEMNNANSKIFFRHKQNDLMLPQVEGRFMEMLTSKDPVMQKLNYAFKDLYQVREDDEQYLQDQREALNPDGTKVRLVPTRYMTRLKNPEMLTHDLVGAVIQYAGMAENFKQMSAIAPEMEQILDMVRQQKYKTNKGFKTEESSRTFNKLNELIEQFVYGAAEDNLEVTFGSKKQYKVSISKVLDNIAKYTRINGMGNNLHVILTGVVTNKIGALIEALSEMYYDKKAYALAKLEMQKSYASALCGIGSANTTVKVIGLMEFCGVGRTLEEQFSNLDQNRIYKVISKKFFFGGYELGDYTSKAPAVVAIFMSYKLDPETGKFVNKFQYLTRFKDKKEGEASWNNLKDTLYDAFEMKGNEFVLKSKYKSNVDEMTLTKVRNTCKQVATRIDTQLSDLDKAFVTSNAVTKLFLIYRNFLLVNLQTKFITKRGYNYATGAWQEAQYRGFANYLMRHFMARFGDKSQIEALKAQFSNYDDLDYFEKKLFQRCVYEILFCTVGMFLISNICMAIADDDRHDEMKQLLALIALRSSIEVRTNVIPIETVNLFKSPTAAWGIIENLLSALKMLFDDPGRRITSGSYRGKTRWERSLIKLSPLRSFFEVGNSREKMNYYNNMINML